MTGTGPTDDLRADGVLALRRRWRALAAPDPGQVAGTWDAVFLGPRWLRWAGPRGVALLGLPEWEGKRFDAAEHGGLDGVNVVGGGGTRLPMRAAVAPSAVDGRPALVVTYGGAAPLPWRRVRDELRPLDADRMLALSLLAVPGGAHGALPFLLVRAER